ncbi:rhodanese-like domain-containing protein [Apilactobacillus micheneri]|uniref:rhodanese-like domain-containing protein n=1 Tax=Apilactobacillus micheneri TaxID=1899430 RepID=UPI000D02ED7B|nr:rhodanese-like domain-containing protein [Apilactobacillus micheneri]TPR35867.1 rhodanese-like domain-containing protein [Apilactobacillus micheneri]TPR40190.1 rhodanese-like domain-containing protein [Apilactobacillus micheneri]GAY80150.1 thiosulfate sulfurtransferase GlpE [Apilactobacillus micheneri]
MISSLMIVLLIIVVFFAINLSTRLRAKKAAKIVSEDEFQKGSHRGQIIDLRETRDFDAGHVLGARSMPYSTLKTFYGNIRSDLPVYLYDQGMTISMRAAILLNKKGYKKLYILKSGYRNWNGKTKK